MRVRISSHRPPVKVWFPLHLDTTRTISSFKTSLCTSLPAFRTLVPTSLHLSIDGFELLDASELSIVRDGDLICVDVIEQLQKRKRRLSSSSSESDTSTSSDSDTSSTPSLQSVVKAKPDVAKPDVDPSTCVPPGYGKPQTRSRNLRRRFKRLHEHEADNGPVSGANAVVVPEDNHTLLSLSLRNKNKARNFKSLMRRPLPPKIIFADQALPRLIPPSSRSSLPSNVFVTSVDVEHQTKSIDIDKLESIVDAQWATLTTLTKDAVTSGMFVAYKGLGINPVTYTPDVVLTVVNVVSSEPDSLVVKPFRATVSFSGPVGTEEERYAWEDIEHADWRIVHPDLPELSLSLSSSS